MIFWFTGQPGSGKTTLGKALVDKLDDVFHIDGDDLRGLSANVDYSEPVSYTHLTLPTICSV